MNTINFKKYELRSYSCGHYKICNDCKRNCKVFNKGKKWHTYATRVPLPGEMIHVNGETTVINDGGANYIRDYYDFKEYYKYYVLTRRNKWHTRYKVIWVDF